MPPPPLVLLDSENFLFFQLFFYVLKQVLIYFRRMLKWCVSVNVLWTRKPFMTFPPDVWVNLSINRKTDTYNLQLKWNLEIKLLFDNCVQVSINYSF